MTSHYYPNQGVAPDWYGLAGEYARLLFKQLGFEDKWAIEDYIRYERSNPLVDILQDDPLKFVAATELAGDGTTNMAGTSRAVVLCQMMLYDRIGGPDGDNKPKGLRRHWYAYYKVFAQMFAHALGKTTINAQGVAEMNDLQWSGRLSQTYAGFVDGREVTYREMWVEDASRMMEVFGRENQLFNNFQLVIAVEKDSLFQDFVSAAQAMGAMAVISGKGKNSKAATELMLRKAGWTSEYDPMAYNPTYVLHLSDHDFDGEGVIGPTFGSQIDRYCHNIIEARIGVHPQQVEEKTPDAWEASYQVKVSNKGYREWADGKALFWAECRQCGHNQYVIGVDSYGDAFTECYNCGQYSLAVPEDSYKRPHGFEVESLKTTDYYEAMVDALLSLIDWDDLVYEIRGSAEPPAWEVVEKVKREYLEQNPKWVKVNAARKALSKAQQTLEWSIEQSIQERVQSATDATKDEWMYLGEDPLEDDFRSYVVRSGRNGYGYAWQPFDLSERIDIVVEELKADDDLTELVRGLDIDDYDDVVNTVRETLTD